MFEIYPEPFFREKSAFLLHLNSMIIFSVGMNIKGSREVFYPCQAWTNNKSNDLSSMEHTSSSCSSGNSEECDLSSKANGDNKREAQKNLAIRKPWKAVAGFTLALLWSYWRRKRRRIPHHKSKAALFLAWLSNLVMTHFTKNRIAIRTPSFDINSSTEEAPISMFLALAKQGRVSKALLNNNTIAFLTNENKWRRSLFPFVTDGFHTEVLKALTEGGCTDIAAIPKEPQSWTSLLTTPLAIAFPFIYLGVLYQMMKRLQMGQQRGVSDMDSSTINQKQNHSTIRFDCVAGLEDAKTELQEIVHYLQNPNFYRSMGARAPRGVLLYGPTGTGKTLLARAVAGEAQCSVFVQCSASNFCELWVGRGAARVRALFQHARQQALMQQKLQQGRIEKTSAKKSWSLSFKSALTSKTNKSCDKDLQVGASAIVFIDEIDAIAKCRVGGLHGNDEREQTLNQLLTEMDGFDSRSDCGVTCIVITATNRPDILDPSLLRPGRLDRHVYVGLPNQKGREDILRLHARSIRLDMYSVDLERVACITEGFSGAELANVVNESAFIAIRQGMTHVSQSQLLQAVERVSNMKHGG